MVSAEKRLTGGAAEVGARARAANADDLAEEATEKTSAADGLVALGAGGGWWGSRGGGEDGGGHGGGNSDGGELHFGCWWLDLRKEEVLKVFGSFGKSFGSLD